LYNLVVTMVSWTLIDPAVAAPITLFCYKAAAEGFVVQGLADNNFTPNSAPRSDFQKPFPMFHESMGRYTESDRVVYEKYHSLKEHMLGYQAYAQVAGTVVLWNQGQSSVVGPPPVAAVPAYGIERMALFYRFRRGGMRLRLLQKSSELCCGYFVSGAQSSATFVVNSNINTSLDVEIPYTAPVPYLDATHVSTSSFIFTAGSSPKYLLKAVADDFHLFFLRAYPYGVMSSLGATGSRGLVAYGYN